MLFLRRCIYVLNDLLHHPGRVFWVCLALAATAVIVDGTLFRLWSLHRDHELLKERIQGAQARSRVLEFRIQKAQQPEFIEKAARDQFDLVKEGDLIFIFSDETPDKIEKPKNGQVR